MITAPSNEVDTIGIRKEIERNNDLFALPEAVVKTLELSCEENVSLEEIADIIKSDPALAGRLLKIANSPFYGVSQQIRTPLNAVMALGLTTVKCLVLSVAIFNHHKISQNLNIDIKSLYGNIISVATTCRKLAQTCKYKEPDEAFVSGMLFEIGLLYYLQYYPGQYKEVIAASRKGSDWQREEIRVFGISHAEVGSLIAQQWRLPKNIISAIENHHSFGFKGSSKLDDIVRLAVSLNPDFTIGPVCEFEEKIARVNSISERLGIEARELDKITGTTLSETVQLAKILDLNIGSTDDILARANKEIFNTYMSILKLFKERQELTRNILTEERQRGVAEAKMIAISTLSHYINNSSMIISGQSQVIRMMLRQKNPKTVVEALDRNLNIIDDAVKKTVAVLEEISELNTLDDIEFFDQSKILNIDDRIKERMAKLKEIQVIEKSR